MPTFRLNRRAGLRLLLGGMSLALAACGRKGAPLPPYNVDPCYPRHYPMSDGAKAECAQKEEYAREHPPQPQQSSKKGQKPRDTTPPEQPPAAEPSAPAAPTPSDQPSSPTAPTPPADRQPQ